jgi:hypothetical protein
VISDSRFFIAATFFFLLVGCCESRWCAFDRGLDSLPAQEAKAKVEMLSNEDLLDFQAWQVVKSHPPNARFRSVVVERGNRIVPTIINRLGSGTGLVDMDLIDLLLDINRTSQLAITDEQMASVVERCLATYIQNSARCAAFEKQR